MRSHKSKFMILGVALAMGLAEFAPASDSSRSDADQLQGKWQLVYQEMDGKKLPDEKQAEMFHATMVFTGDKIRYCAELPGFDLRFSYRLHPEQQPKGIDLTLTETPDGKNIGQRLLGIYRLKEGTLEICDSDTNRPANFRAGEGTHQGLIVLRRAANSP